MPTKLTSPAVAITAAVRRLRLTDRWSAGRALPKVDFGLDKRRWLAHANGSRQPGLAVILALVVLGNSPASGLAANRYCSRIVPKKWGQAGRSPLADRTSPIKVRHILDRGLHKDLSPSLVVQDKRGEVATDRSNDELVRGSRKSIVETGFSERYFDEHFRLVRLANKPGDIKVVWKYSLNGYEAIVVDSIGYYTAENQKRVYVHSIKDILGSTQNITKTIPRRNAERLMKACLGRYSGEAVEFMRLSPNEQTSLYLTAHSATKSIGRADAGTRDRKAGERATNQNQEADQPEREETEKHPPIYLGYVNLETGKCTKGQAMATP